MASAKNKVIGGKYSGCWVVDSYSGFLGIGNNALSYRYKITKDTINAYETVTEQSVKSGSSAILRGAAGAALLGPVGLLAGLSAKNKGIHTIVIQWKSGESSLIEIDDKKYKVLISSMF